MHGWPPSQGRPPPVDHDAPHPGLGTTRLDGQHQAVATKLTHTTIRGAYLRWRALRGVMEPDSNVESLPRRLADGIAPEALRLTGLMVAAWFKLLFRRRRG